jgi:hypothetical protein
MTNWCEKPDFGCGYVGGIRHCTLKVPPSYGVRAGPWIVPTHLSRLSPSGKIEHPGTGLAWSRWASLASRAAAVMRKMIKMPALNNWEHFQSDFKRLPLYKKNCQTLLLALTFPVGRPTADIPYWSEWLIRSRLWLPCKCKHDHILEKCVH